MTNEINLFDVKQSFVSSMLMQLAYQKHGMIIDLLIYSEILTEGESELREYFKCL